MIPHRPILTVAMLAMVVASGCPGELDWECHADKPCPNKGEICVAPQNLPDGSTEPVTDPACYAICSSSAQCPGGNRACLGELCVLFDDDCSNKDCPEGFFCNTLSHCEKLPCSSATGVCAASCTDGLRDGDESDADCGGSCTPCADGRRCDSGSDCQSGVCDSAGLCAVPTCTDSVKNASETSIDCGGPCDGCSAGEPCRDAGDCAGAVCSSNVCQPSRCDDGIENGGETAIDCGGPCAGCPDGFPCNGPDDCDSHVCANHKCATGTCDDGAENGDETDEDCGGPCEKCAAGLKCSVAADCESGVCDADHVCRLLLSLGSTGNDWAGSVAVDADPVDGDAILVTGATANGLDLGGGVVPAGVFLARLEPSGRHVWSAPLQEETNYAALAVDAEGNAVVAGDAGHDIYIGSFSRAGGERWKKTFDSVDGIGAANDVAVDNTGNVLVAGYFSGYVDFGDGRDDPQCPRLTSANMSAFVAKFSTNGACLWRKGFGNDYANSCDVSSVAADSVVVAGSFLGSIDLGGGERTSAGSNDVFVVKLFSDGSHDWSKTFGGSEFDAGFAVADTRDGVVFTGGFESNNIDFGGEPLENRGGSSLFVAKLALDGSHVWSKSFGGTESSLATVGRVGVDADDNITLTGRFGGTISFGGSTLDSGGSTDIFVARLASGGEHVRSHRFGGPDPDWGSAVGIDSSGRAVIIGGFAGEVDFGGSALNSAGGADICVFTVAP